MADKLTVYHISINKKMLCGRVSTNCISGDNKCYYDIKEIVNMSKKFMRLCKICAKIKTKECNES